MLKRESSERIDRWQFRFENGPVEQVTTPHSWNAFDTMRLDESWFQRGVGVYETDLSFPEPAEGDDKRTTQELTERRRFIRFGAASQKAVVFLDGVEIGRNEGGYLPFTVELPQASKGQLKVEVDNSPDIHLPPSDRSDFFLYGGLTRPVTLYTTGACRIAQLQIDSSIVDDQGQLALGIVIDGEGQDLVCEIRVVIKVVWKFHPVDLTLKAETTRSTCRPFQTLHCGHPMNPIYTKQKFV